MEKIDSPYIYEKPLRQKRSSRNRTIGALGLVALGTIIGGSAFASSVINEAVADTGAQGIDPVVLNTDATSVTEVADINSGAVEGQSPFSSAFAESPEVDPIDSIISVPLEQAKPKRNSAAIDLPALANNSFGNTSSATPYASGSNAQGATGSNISAGTYLTRERSDRERYEDRNEKVELEDQEDD